MRDGLEPDGVWQGRNGEGCQPKRELTMLHMYPLMSSARWGDKVVKKRHVNHCFIRPAKKIKYKYNNGKPRTWIDSKVRPIRRSSRKEQLYGNTGRRRHVRQFGQLYVTYPTRSIREVLHSLTLVLRYTLLTLRTSLLRETVIHVCAH
jgi:hypothetical protein